MTITTQKIAQRFVDLPPGFVRCDYRSDDDRAAQENSKVLFDVVVAAGFDPKKVILGRLTRRYSDSNETYPINSLCPFKVVNQEDEDDYCATGWLDCIVRKVNSAGRLEGEKYIMLIKEIEHEIEKSIPLQPIQLTIDGDELLEYPKDGYLPGHTRDNHKLDSCVGVHAYCKSWMDRVRATAKHDAILCRGCHLRVLFPREVATYGNLRVYLTALLAES